MDREKSGGAVKAAMRAARPSAVVDTRVIHCGDNLDQLKKLADGCVDLIYIDPPFNSNRTYEVFWGEAKRTTDNAKRTTDNAKRTTDNAKRTTDNEKRTTKNQEQSKSAFAAKNQRSPIRIHGGISSCRSAQTARCLSL